jgi:hypothetical protein
VFIFIVGSLVVTSISNKGAHCKSEIYWLLYHEERKSWQHFLRSTRLDPKKSGHLDLSFLDEGQESLPKDRFGQESLPKEDQYLTVVVDFFSKHTALYNC